MGGGWQIKNVLHSTCSFRIRPGNADRISVEPSTVSLAPGETKRVQVKLKLQGKLLPKKKGGAAYRDTVQLKSDFFEKKFVVTFQPAGYSMLQPLATVLGPVSSLCARPVHVAPRGP